MLALSSTLGLLVVEQSFRKLRTNIPPRRTETQTGLRAVGMALLRFSRPAGDEPACKARAFG